MKRIGFIMLLAAMVLLSGCAAYFGNEAQYEKGDWYLFAGADETARIKQDKLAFEKLKSQPTDTAVVNGVAQGYKGIVANLGRERYDFRVNGPENKNYLLGPGERVVDYLLPGKYEVKTYYGGNQVGGGTFHVGPQTQTFMNEKYHWFVYAEW